VSTDALVRLRVGVGFDHDGTEWASFPSRNENWEIVGIIRRYNSGRKRTLCGTSNAGIFAVPEWNLTDTLYVVEGASDVAACYDHGLSSIGRPSNTGGADLIAKIVSQHRFGKIVVVGEHDRKPERVGDERRGCKAGCPGCAWCWPGRYGAVSVAGKLRSLLGRQVDVFMPPVGYKDMREWLTKGEPR